MVGATPIDASNHTAGEVSRQSQAHCDKKCGIISLSIILPVLAIAIGWLLACALVARRRAKRDAKNKEDEEKDIAMRKLGAEDDWGSVSERSVAQPEMAPKTQEPTAGDGSGSMEGRTIG